MNGKLNTRALTEGAIMAALTALLGVMSYYIPFLTFFIFIWPIPIIILGKRHGLSVSIIATFVAGILVSLFTPPIFAIQLIIMYGLLGVALGYAYEKEMNVVKTVLLGYITSLVSIVVLFQFYNIITGVNIITEFTQMMSTSIEEINRMYQQMGVDPNTLEQTMDRAEAMVDTLKLLFPAMVLIMPTIVTGINMFVAKKLLRRLGYKTIEVPPFRNWKLPNHASYGLFLIVILSMLGQYLNFANFDMVYSNVVYLIIIVFFVQGLAVVSYFFHWKGTSKALRIIGYIFILLLPLLQTVVQFIGLFDVLFNFRDRIKFRQN